jgi:hypothetical protein
MRAVLIAVAFTLLAPLAFAQLQQVQPPHGPQLMAGEEGHDAKDRKPLGLAAADVRVVILGPIAQTTMTLTFRNDTNRQLEGELTFPLPEGATVSGFGLDVNGTLVDGVPVERQKARITYEKEMRKRVDPGLVEQEVGNNFRTRVYPIPPSGKRTVKIQYVADVIEGKDGATYRLPLGWEQPVDEASLFVEMATPITAWGGGAPIRLESGPIDLPGFSPDGGRWHSQAKAQNARLDKDLVVALMKLDHEVIVERHVKGATVQEMIDKKAKGGKDEWYFAVSEYAPAAPVAIDQLERKPSRVGVLWDASLSRLSTDKAREVALLRKVIAGMDANGTIDLIAFRNEPEPPVSFAVRDGADKIVAAIEKLTYDGGTNLSLLPIVKNYASVPGAPGIAGQAPADYAFWLLFTDGIADLGPEMPKSLAAPCYAISNDARSNHTLLRRIASETGGQYLNLQRIGDDDAAGLIGREPFALLGVDAKDGEVADVYPRGAVPAMGRMTVVGKLLVPEAKVTLKYGRGGVVTARSEVTLRQYGASETGLVPRFWAQQKVTDISSDVEANREALLAVGKEFSLVTPNTSLLVLETVEQYLEHRIVPPRSYQPVYDEFMKRIEQEQKQLAQSREERIQQVLAMWNPRVQWWEQKHGYAKDFKFKAPADEPVAARTAAIDAPRAAFRADLGRGAAAAAGPAPLQPATPTPMPGGRPAVQEPASETTPHNAEAARQRLPDAPALSLGTSAATAAPAESRREFDRLSSQSQAGLQGRDAAADGTVMLGGIALKANGEKPQGGEASLAVAIKQWDPDVPYLKAMRESGNDADAAYTIYLKQRPNYLASPAFYLDCADYLLHNGHTRLGVRVLTNVAELKLEDAQLLRIVAHRLNQLGQRELAIDLFERIQRTRPEEPQSWRDLALALSDRADAAVAAAGTDVDRIAPSAQADYRRAMELLNHVVMNKWDRFEEIEVTALMEANRILAAMNRLPSDKPYPVPLDLRLVKNLDCDVRIVLTWDADLTDVDLWVTEPSGEKCFYQHNRTTIGGLLSRDFTQGYGPEEYCLRNLMPGEYKIQCNYYGSTQTSLVGPATVQATVITHFGRPDEKRQSLTVRLAQKQDVVDIGTVTLK